jgi:plastocyanin
MRHAIHGIGIAILALAAVRAEAADHRVSVGGASVRFDPPDITINVGDTVTWVSQSPQSHNVHANDDSFRCAAGCDGQGGSGGPRPGPWTATVAFTRTGVYGYRCDPHADYGMRGVVRVVEGGGGGGDGDTTHVPITSGFTGAWYDPEQSGHGILIEVLPGNQLLAWWFTFNPEGTQQAWFGNVGSIDDDTATVPALQTEGGRWIPNFDPANVTQPAWGTLTFQFTDCNHGEVTFDSAMPGYGSGHMNLVRLTQPAGVTCP